MKKLIILLFAAVTVFSVFPQGGSKISLLAMPEAAFPLGDSSENFEIGYGGSFAAEFMPQNLSNIFFKGNIGYLMIPTIAETNLSIAAFSLNAGYIFRPAELINIRFSAGGGYYAGMYEGENGSDLFYSVDSLFSFIFNPTLSMGLGAVYRDFLATSEGLSLYRGFGVNAGTLIRLGGTGRDSGLEMERIQILPVFPVFYKYYDDNPLGNLSIRNSENSSLKDIELSLFVENYMDSPKVFATIREIKPGEEKIVPVYGLFNDKLLEITEATKLPAKFKCSYSYLGKGREREISETVRFYDRNAMTWDDDRKAASFVTAKDPEILRYAKYIAGTIRGKGTKTINNNFRLAMGVFQSLRDYNINYVIDPQTPYEEFSRDSLSIDYLQFPVQTMNYKAGDCDDLSIMYSALLESVGIETAFITVPGHIYMAFSLDITMEEAGKIFSDTRNLIFENGKTWLPVEITMIQDGFTRAWDEGAKEWRENFRLGQANLFPVHESWKTYEPVGSPKTASNIRIPDDDAILSSYISELDKVILRELQPRIAELQREISESGNYPSKINSLGVLYARYGYFDKAETEFRKIVAKTEYLPALVNMGNISFLRENYSEALDYYRRANSKNPENLSSLLGIAKVSYELEKYDTVQTAFAKVENLNPSLADEYSYLVSKSDAIGRASSRDNKEKTLWDEE